MAGNYAPDVYVRADGTATTVAGANDPSSASSAYSLATLDADKANTAGLIVGFSSQGGTFTDASALNTVNLCVECQGGSTYTNVAGETAAFNIQDDAGTTPQILRGPSVTGALIDENLTGGITLTGSGTGKVIEFSGAGTNTIGTLTIISNHTSANNDCDDGISTRGTCTLNVGAVTVNGCISTSALTTVAQAFTAHDTSAIVVDGAALNNCSQFFACAGGACSITASNITGTDWDDAVCALNGSETVVINDSIFLNDGSVRAASVGKILKSANTASGTCTFNDSSITVSANGGTQSVYGIGARFQLNDTDITIGAGTTVRHNWGQGSTGAITLGWSGGTYTVDANTILPFVIYEDGVLDIERVLFTNSSATSAGTVFTFSAAAAQGTRSIRSCIFEYPHTGGAIFQYLSSSNYDMNVQQCTFYSRGVVNNVPAGASGVAFDNCTFNGDGSNIVFESDDPFTYDYCHFRDITNEPTSTNEVGAGADPQFTTPGSDYTIPNTSPLYHAGKDLTVTTDFAGNTFHATTPSVGAYEYSIPNNALLANSVESVSEVTIPTLVEGIEYTLNASSIESASEVGAPALSSGVGDVFRRVIELSGRAN